jgi:mRNA interferase YafQ
MRKIDRSSAFKRDYKRIKATPRHKDIDALLAKIVGLLANDKPLEPKHRDHSLGGNWNGHRECHMKPDLLLIYKKPDALTLWLVRMGSHSELFAK